jgi:hypothetical protein
MALTQIIGSGISGTTINSNGILIPKGVILQVQASNTDQSFDPSSGFGKVEWESVEIDTISGWSTSNHRYTPSVAGYYLCGGSVRILTSGAYQTASFEIRKSDSGTGTSSGAIRTQFQFSSDIITNTEIPLPTGMLEMNGSTDYIEVFVDSDETITLHDNADRRSHFFAMLVHAT